MKTKNFITSQKVFLNICQTDAIPAPADITDSELTDILDSDEPSSFRIPMSLGEGHEEVDKCTFNPCTSIWSLKFNSFLFFLQLAINALLTMLQLTHNFFQRLRATCYFRPF